MHSAASELCRALEQWGKGPVYCYLFDPRSLAGQLAQNKRKSASQTVPVFASSHSAAIHQMDLTTCAVAAFQNPGLEALRVRAFNDMVARVSQEEKYQAMEASASDYEKHEIQANDLSTITKLS